ncbi:hypothetical protein FB567DRAFT_13721 [Paraphoma chrysanthemicola]|uniref:Uncharacterized protein n=1 Tax=Paraphoma chrysanthemicola TaxID=798071 RepID=A0A8K0RKC8_9PLEO|nr:hypothetical protein FB567DRAFT_13721 [Paraphoma chrysanthemicola]
MPSAVNQLSLFTLVPTASSVASCQIHFRPVRFDWPAGHSKLRGQSLLGTLQPRLVFLRQRSAIVRRARIWLLGVGISKTSCVDT